MGATLDTAQAQAYLAGIQARIAHPQPALAHIGAAQAARVQARIRADKTTPEAEAWAPWAARTTAARKRKGNAQQGLLWDSGALLRSVTAQASSDGVTIGTDTAYAGYLQSGTARMPARPFLGWGAADIDSAGAYMAAFVEGMA